MRKNAATERRDYIVSVRRSQVALAFFLFIFLLIGHSWPAAAELFRPETFNLSNGMQVVVLTNRRAPVVTQMVWYKVGAADDPWGTSGLAHFLEHMMFRGSKAVPPGAFAHRIAENGGTSNAFTSWDYTAYHQTIARDRLELVMKMEADRMANLQLDQARLLPERDVILEERRSRVDNSPAAILSEQMYAALFRNSRYGRPIIGWAHEMQALSLKNVSAFYHGWYAPNNAILIVAGDIDAQELKPLAEKYYGGIAKRSIPVRLRPTEPKNKSGLQRRVILYSADVRQPNLRHMYLAPSPRSVDPLDICAIQVLTEILGGGATSRLHRKLVLEKSVAIGAAAYYEGNFLGETVLNFSLTPRGDTEITQRMMALDGALTEELEDLIKNGVTEEEVRLVRERLIASTAFARDDLESAARIIGEALATGDTIEDIASWPQRIAAVTAERVNKMARSILVEENSVVGQLMPSQSEGKP
ncbi:MAG: pitrilysin family protein [Alphaproteobacteria bacterium]